MRAKAVSISMTADDQKLIAKVSKEIARRLQYKYTTTQIMRWALRSLAKELGL